MHYTYVVEPYKGFNDVSFGELRNTVRKKLGVYTDFKKNKFSKNTADDFGNLHTFYDEKNTLEAVEFFKGELYLEGRKLFPTKKDELFTVLSNTDHEAIVSNDSVESKMLGIHAYAPSDTVESLLIYRVGYYD